MRLTSLCAREPRHLPEDISHTRTVWSADDDHRFGGSPTSRRDVTSRKCPSKSDKGLKQRCASSNLTQHSTAHTFDGDMLYIQYINIHVEDYRIVTVVYLQIRMAPSPPPVTT